VTKTIVIVDEHPHVVSTLSSALARAGFTVRGAHTFHDGMALLQQTEPDAVIVSVELGAFNGLHLLLHVNALHPSARVLVMGPPSPAMADEARALGAASYMPRPITTDGVLDQLNGLFFSPVRPFVLPRTKRQAAGLR